jgi:superoxide dismutase
MAQALRSKFDKWDLMKLKSFCKAKDTVSGTGWEMIFTNPTSNIALISKIYKELKTN